MFQHFHLGYHLDGSWRTLGLFLLNIILEIALCWFTSYSDNNIFFNIFSLSLSHTHTQTSTQIPSLETCVWSWAQVAVWFHSTVHNFYCFLVSQSCPTLCNPMDCSPPDSSVHGIKKFMLIVVVIREEHR